MINKYDEPWQRRNVFLCVIRALFCITNKPYQNDGDCKSIIAGKTDIAKKKNIEKNYKKHSQSGGPWNVQSVTAPQFNLHKGIDRKWKLIEKQAENDSIVNATPRTSHPPTCLQLVSC